MVSDITIFSYDLLAVEIRNELESAEQAIKSHITRNERLVRQANMIMEEAHQEIVAIGDILFSMKAQFPGHFMNWRSSVFEFSDDTAENMMSVAKNARQLPAGTQGTQAGVYDFSKVRDPEIKERLTKRAAAGVALDRHEVYLNEKAPNQILARYLDNELPKKQAVKLVEAVNKAEENVQSIALTNDFAHAEAVTYLNRAFLDRDVRSTWDDLRAANFYLEGAGVYLHEANQRDIDHYIEIRRQNHIGEAIVQRDLETDAELRFDVPITGPSIMIVDEKLLEHVGKNAHVIIRVQKVP